MKKTLLTLALLFACTNATETNRDERAVEQCCDQLYLSASGTLAENQEGVLGVYNYSGIDEYGRPYYMKEIYGAPVYLYYKESREAGGGQGWIVGSKLHSASLYMSTRSTTNPFCPVGIEGGFDRDVEADETFSIECHEEVVEHECCFSVWVNSSQDGPLWSNQSVFVGKYDMAGAFNGFPYYHKNQYEIDTYLYYRKQGDLPRDGWALNSVLGANFLSVTTRDSSDCPDGINVAYDRDIYEDKSVTMTCDDFVEEKVLPESSTTSQSSLSTSESAIPEAERGGEDGDDSSATNNQLNFLSMVLTLTLSFMFNQ